jgi:hypothetical protein
MKVYTPDVRDDPIFLTGNKFDRYFVIIQEENIINQYIILYGIIHPPILSLRHYIPEEVIKKTLKADFWNSSEFFNMSIPELQILYEFEKNNEIKSSISELVQIACQMEEFCAKWRFEHGPLNTDL